MEKTFSKESILEGFLMENVLKTKAVSELLDVNPTTVHRWVKYFNIPCQTNEKGHYLFKDQDVELLKGIKTQLNAGLQLREIKIEQLSGNSKNNSKHVPTAQYEQQTDKFIDRIEHLEQKLSGKADEVVSYQVLQHRSELDSMMSLLKEMEDRILVLEEKLANKNEEAIAMSSEKKKVKKNWLVSMFTP